jgi:hypothetical protein
VTAEADTLAQLQACLADLDAYIERRAQVLADPVIRQARARAAGQIKTAGVEAQRQSDLVRELRKRLEVQERMREDARTRLAALLGYARVPDGPGLPPLDVLVDDMEKALAGRNGHAPEAETTERARHFPEMPPKLDGEDAGQYTDRLTGADGTGRVPYDHPRNRQCSIGFHEECSDPAGKHCKCPCHIAAGRNAD